MVDFGKKDTTPGTDRSGMPSQSEVQAAEARAAQIDPSFTPATKYQNQKYYSSRLKHAQDTIREAEERDTAISNAQRDLKLGVRSEFGQDGPETYFETYVNPIKVGIVNLFFNQRNDNYFLLGSGDGAGILGSMQLGSNTVSRTRVQEVQPIQDFTDNFTTTTYKDATTTAGGWGTGSLVFTTAGSLAVFSSWKSGSYSLTQFDRIRVDIQYTQYGGSLTTFRASFDGGSNYTTIDPFSEVTISPVGSDFRLEVKDPHGSLILRKVDIITKGEQFG